MGEDLKVAIACQGGGSHAAFAAGVLMELLSAPAQPFTLKAISGTSGGAICAALAWTGLLAGGPEQAVWRLASFWERLKAKDPASFLINAVSIGTARLPWTLEVSPYLVPAPAEDVMRVWLADELQLDKLRAPTADDPGLLIGTTEVLSGRRAVITGPKLSYDALIASAAVPFLYKAIEVEGRWMWDGLFCVNPPVNEMLDYDIDELWVVQINPQATESVPRSTTDIVDRRNELSGNLALAQELHFAHVINQLIDANGTLRKPGKPGAPPRDYRKVTIRVLDAGLVSTKGTSFDYASKLDRNPAFIADLIDRGQKAAGGFFQPRTLWPPAEGLEAVGPPALTAATLRLD